MNLFHPRCAILKVVRTKNHIPLIGTILSVMATGKSFACDDGHTYGMECQAHVFLCSHGEVVRSDVFKQNFLWDTANSNEQEVEYIATYTMHNWLIAKVDVFQLEVAERFGTPLQLVEFVDGNQVLLGLVLTGRMDKGLQSMMRTRIEELRERVIALTQRQNAVVTVAAVE